MKLQHLRNYAIASLYLAAAAHMLVALVLVCCADSALLQSYHDAILPGFFAAQVPQQAQALQAWWMQLFGATLECLSIWMASLIWLGAQQRKPAIWLCLIFGLLIWAPQDIWLSLRAGVWSHVWVDLLALGLILPPLCLLWRIDRHAEQAQPQAVGSST